MKLNLKSKLRNIFVGHRRAWLVSLSLALVATAGWLAFLAVKTNQTVVRTDPSANATLSQPVIKFKPSPLSGLDVAPSIADGQVLAVMIENSPDARPQSGLNQASVVFEAIAEGGITRFLALYLDNQPAVIGPIRSVRPYYIDWLDGFDAAVAHVGGSTEGLALLKQLGIKNLDQFANGGYYHRTTDRYAPHNVYTSYAEMAALMKAKGFTHSTFDPLLRKDEAPAKKPTAATIDINISSALYNVQYIYDANTNAYDRYMAGHPHKDRESTKQIQPKVVVVIKIPTNVADSVGHLHMTTVGSGEAWIFQDGLVKKVTWKKASRTAQIKFTDANGKSVALNRGQTWITVIPTNKSVTYKP